MLERVIDSVVWTCTFDDTDFFISAENKSFKRLKIEIVAALKAKGEHGIGTQPDTDLTRKIGIPVFTNERWSARTKAFVLKSAFKQIFADIDFRSVQTFQFTEYQLFSNNTFSSAQGCADLLHAVERLMALLHQERLDEIKKMGLEPGLRVRRQLRKLTVGDLKKFAQWEFASDEEDAPGQDETTLRPCFDEVLSGGEGCYVLRTTFTLADGTSATGFVTSTDSSDHYRLMEPTVILGGKHLPLVLWQPSSLKKQLALWGKSRESIFPLRLSSDVRYNGKPISIVMKDFITVE